MGEYACCGRQLFQFHQEKLDSSDSFNDIAERTNGFRRAYDVYQIVREWPSYHIKGSVLCQTLNRADMFREC